MALGARPGYGLSAMVPVPEGTELLEHLGAGSVFDVAVVREGGRALVCKRLCSRARGERAGRAAIVREAKALSLARHPALPALVRVGADAHGPFVLETVVRGASLRAILDGWQARGRRPPRLLVAHVIRAAFAALAEIHAIEGADGGGPLELAHGDISPDHVILGPIGDVGFVDLGAARFRGMDPALETGDRGTLPFVAPEVARAESPPTQRADTYALAAALAWFATGQPLTVAREEAAALAEIGGRGLALDALRAEPSLSAATRDALLGALARDPSERTGSARAVCRALDEENEGG